MSENRQHSAPERASIGAVYRSENSLLPDRERCLTAVAQKDARFDGWFYVGVTSTGIYCRPSCPARTPKAENMTFHPTAASAQAAGFRACKRCRPNASPGSPEWNLRADVASRALRLIADGVVDREGVGGLARRLGYSERQLQRVLVAEAGAGPLAIARAERAQNARLLLEGTALTAGEIAGAAGFSSVRQFNATIQEVFAATPSELRARRKQPAAAKARGIELQLAARQPFDFAKLHRFLADRAVVAVEHAGAATYARSLDLPHGDGVVELSAATNGVRARFELSDLRDLATATERVRRLCDLDADPVASDRLLAEDSRLRQSVAARPGIRVPGTVSGDEIAIRAVLGQQISVRGAATAAAKLTALCGRPLSKPVGEITHCFPRAEQLAALRPEDLPMPRARGRALIGLAAALASGEIVLDGADDRHRVHAQLLALPGIGEWTAQYIQMRALHHPDAFMASDLGVRHGLEAIGLDGAPRAAQRAAEHWSPYRAYALQHLWAIAAEATNQGKAK